MTSVCTLWHIRRQPERQPVWLLQELTHFTDVTHMPFYATMCSGYSAASQFAIILHAVQDTVVTRVYMYAMRVEVQI